MKIVADDKIPYLKGALEPFAEMVYRPGGEFTVSDVKDADALIIRTRTRCNQQLLEGSRVKFIATATIGYDHIDTEYCRSHGIEWTNAPGCNSGSVMQYIVAALLQIAGYKKTSLKGKTLGVIGVGNVGRKVVTAARALGMQVLQNDPPRAEAEGVQPFTPLAELLASSDIITLHVPLSMSGPYKTYHLMDYKKMTQMKKGVVLINTSRGEVVDNKALKAAIIQEFVDEAVLDVFENEPDIDKELLCMLLLATPHIAGYSADGKANGTAMSVQAISRFFSLDYHNWYPKQVPEPENPVISSLEHSPESILRDLVQQTYQITRDDDDLKAEPGSFEALRGNYRVRREFQAFTVSPAPEDGSVLPALRDLGFSIK